jgi:hypothetical protein
MQSKSTLKNNEVEPHYELKLPKLDSTTRRDIDLGLRVKIMLLKSPFAVLNWKNEYQQFSKFCSILVIPYYLRLMNDTSNKLTSIQATLANELAAPNCSKLLLNSADINFLAL